MTLSSDSSWATIISDQKIEGKVSFKISSLAKDLQVGICIQQTNLNDKAQYTGIIVTKDKGLVYSFDKLMNKGMKIGEEIEIIVDKTNNTIEFKSLNDTSGIFEIDHIRKFDFYPAVSLKTKDSKVKFI